MSARVKFGNHARSHACATCGANARRKWCRLHDPARRDRRLAHQARVVRALKKVSSS